MFREFQFIQATPHNRASFIKLFWKCYRQIGKKGAKHHVLVYMEDSISQLLEHREENPKINPVKILSEYFTSLRDGNHTMFREFQFIQATPHNRASFIKLFWKCYRQIGKKGDLLSIQEYHSLVTLLCPDFPFETVQKTARIILLDDALDCLISFQDFIYAFQVQFYYEEFLDKCLEIYQSMIQTQSSPRNPVVVPSASDDTRIHQNSHHPSDGVDAMQYFRAVYPLCDRMPYTTPPSDALKEILFNVPRVSFYGFLMAIAKSEAINTRIGRLPTKSELLEGADAEITSSYPVRDSRKMHNAEKQGKRRSQKEELTVKENDDDTLNRDPLSKTRNGDKKPPVVETLPPPSSTPSHPPPMIKPSIQQRPRSLSRQRNPPRSQLSRAQNRKKVISSDESSDDSDDDSDDD